MCESCLARSTFVVYPLSISISKSTHRVKNDLFRTSISAHFFHDSLLELPTTMTTGKVHFQFVDDSDGNHYTISASHNDRLVLDETALRQKRESLLSTMASDLWKTDPERGSTEDSPIPVNMTELDEWCFAMIPAIELMYTDPRNNDNDDAAKKHKVGNKTTNGNMITLPERGVELRGLLPVLDYLGLINQDCISSVNVDLSQVQDIPTKIRAKRYLRILQVVQELVAWYETSIEEIPQMRSRFVFGHDEHSEDEIVRHNLDKMLLLFRDDGAFSYANDQDFRNEVDQVFQGQGLGTEWGESRLVVKVLGANDEIEKYGTLTHVDVIVPGPPPSKKAKSNLSIPNCSEGKK